MKNSIHKFKLLFVLLALTLLPFQGLLPLQASSIISISQARASSGTQVTVEGYITGSQAPDVAFMQAIYASGPNDGILVQIANAGTFTGQHVRVTGYVRDMQGHRRINGINSSTPAPITPHVLNSTITQITPIPITLEQVSRGFEGMLISLDHPIEIERIIDQSGTQNHVLHGTSTLLRMNLRVPSSSFINIQGGSWIYVNRGHVLNFLGMNQIYSSYFNQSEYIEMTSISNSRRISTQPILQQAPMTSIASARAMGVSGTRVTVEGHITGSQAANVAFMQSIDASGPNDGILVSITNASALMGRHVRVIGYVQNIQGNLRINGSNSTSETSVARIVIDDSIAEITPIPITQEEAATGFDGMLVSISSVQIAERDSRSGARNHRLFGYPLISLRTDIHTPSNRFGNVQRFSWININRGHVLNFYDTRQVYSSVFGVSGYITMTGICNNYRITLN